MTPDQALREGERLDDRRRRFKEDDANPLCFILAYSVLFVLLCVALRCGGDAFRSMAGLAGATRARLRLATLQIGAQLRCQPRLAVGFIALRLAAFGQVQPPAKRFRTSSPR
jgi:hypothetical protein